MAEWVIGGPAYKWAGRCLVSSGSRAGAGSGGYFGKAGTMFIQVNKCQRCGQDHEELDFEKLKNATDEFKYFANCPNTNQPLFLAIVVDALTIPETLTPDEQTIIEGNPEAPEPGGVIYSSPEALAKSFHENYEKLAPSFGYNTREASAVAWEDVPEANKKLMIATAGAVGQFKFNQWEVIEELEERLTAIAEIIDAVDNRCAAADGAVTPTLQEMTQKEISHIYCLAQGGPLFGEGESNDSI